MIKPGVVEYYPFQDEAIDKMVTHGVQLLAVTMGGGKTLMTIATIEELHAQGEVDTCLWITLSSLKYQALDEIKKYTNARAIVIEGTPSQRRMLYRAGRHCRYIIVNYDLLKTDFEVLKVLPFEACVIDEATAIKSPKAKRSKMTKKVGGRAEYRYALTGQPIENRPEELFSIMEFVDRDVLGLAPEFDVTFIRRDSHGRATRYRNLPALRKRMDHFWFRRSREDIAEYLPKIVPQVIPVEFDTQGAKAYRAIAMDLRRTITDAMGKFGRRFDLWAHYSGEGNDANKVRGDIMARLTVLRMLCDNPHLITRSAEKYAERFEHDDDDDEGVRSGSKYAYQVVGAGLLTGVRATPKLDAVVEYIDMVLDEDPKTKVVCFSFFKDNLRLLQQALLGRRDVPDRPSVQFTGDMNARQKDEAKKRFKADPTCRVFLSSDAGGYGVDLPEANYLINYDLPWSAGKLDQRESRIIRLSSTWPHITLPTFVMHGSIEQRQYQMLEQKRGIGAAWVDGKYDRKTGEYALNLGTLTEFLRDSEV